MHTCPTCSRKFETRRGLGVHHSSAHDQRLPNRTCSNCGEGFYCEYEKKYCSDDCRDASVSFEGANNPNFQGKLERTTCEICGCGFEYYPSEKEGVYCSDCVENESWRPIRDIQGPKNPRWNGGKVELDCAVCDESVERYPSNVTGEVTVCSEECRTEWLSEEFTESGHPNWKGGGDGAYGKGWNRVRRKALERDDYECVVCGKTRDEIGRNPDVHHIVRFGRSPSRRPIRRPMPTTSRTSPRCVSAVTGRRSSERSRKTNSGRASTFRPRPRLQPLAEPRTTTS